MSAPGLQSGLSFLKLVVNKRYLDETVFRYLIFNKQLVLSELIAEPEHHPVLVSAHKKRKVLYLIGLAYAFECLAGQLTLIQRFPLEIRKPYVS